jgi:hypothetical protein
MLRFVMCSWDIVVSESSCLSGEVSPGSQSLDPSQIKESKSKLVSASVVDLAAAGSRNISPSTGMAQAIATISRTHYGEYRPACASAGIAFSCGRWLSTCVGALILAFLGCGLAIAADAKNDPNGQLKTDFQKPLLSFEEAIKDDRFRQFFGEQYLKSQLSRLLVPNVNSPPIRAEHSAKIHIVVRFEDMYSADHYVDVHLPSAIPLESVDHTPNHMIERYSRVLTGTAAAVASMGGLELTTNQEVADVIVNINLAERSETSKGFSYEAMRQYPIRKNLKWSSPDKQRVFVLPWTYVNTYVDEFKSPGLVGGEVWIEYPLRTYWQDGAARILLDDLELANRIGVGATRNELVQAFRTPHKTSLPSLGSALSVIQPPSRVSYAGMSLLTATITSMQPWSDDIVPPFSITGPGSITCFDDQRLRILSASLGAFLERVVYGRVAVTS